MLDTLNTIASFLIALGVSTIVARVFKEPIQRILQRLIADEISTAWERYMRFAIFVVGISQGVRIWELERYITRSPCPPDPSARWTCSRSSN